MKHPHEFQLLSEKSILALIFFAALSLRLLAIINLSIHYQLPGADAADYDILAVNLLSGKGLTLTSDIGLFSSWRVPLYPLFLASIYSVFGQDYFMVRIIQSIMSALLCVIIFYIAKIIFNKKIALLSAILIAFYQPYIAYLYWGGPCFLFSENLFTFLLALLVLFVIRKLFIQFNFKNSLITGILIGLLILTRPFFVLFPLALFILLIYKNKYSPLYTFKKMLPMLISFILVILPWTIRNYRLHKAFVPFSTEGGYALFTGNNPYVDGGASCEAHLSLPEVKNSQIQKMPEVERDKLFRRYAIDFLFKNYKKIPRLFFKKLLVFWDPFAAYYLNGRHRIYNFWFSIIFIFSLFGIVKALRSKLNINNLLLISLLLYFSIMSMIFSGEPRFRYPIEIYLIIFASAGVFSIYRGFKNKIFSYIIITSIVGINLLFYQYSDLALDWVRCVLRLVGMKS